MSEIPARRHPRARRRAKAALALGAVAALLAGCVRTSPPAAPSKIVLIGIDAMDWRLADPLLKEGRLPNIAAMIERGTRADLRSLEPLVVSPIIWTTVATGKGPDKHGISGFVRPGQRAPVYTSDGWTARAVWDILGERGHSVGVVNWMVGWPAKPVAGYNVSDRIIYSPEDGFRVSEHVTYPDGLLEELAPLRNPIAKVSDDAVAPLLGGEDWRTTADDGIKAGVLTLKSIYANDETILAVAKHMLDTREQPDFLAVYVNGLDVACHTYWGLFDPTSLDIPMTQECIDAFKDVIPRYYERIDGLVGQILERVDPGTTVILSSEHGFKGPLRDHQGLRLGTSMHGPVGVLAAHGPGIKKGATVTDASVFDLTPTILALLGEPVARDMDGFVLTAMLDERFLAERPVTYVDTYEREPATGDTAASEEPVASPLDDEIKERLRSLGYIK